MDTEAAPSFQKSQQETKELINEISKVFLGKEDVIRNAILALISGGHVLLEDVPGLGKTLLAKSIARAVSADFKRIQFTADLLPSDISGVTVYSQDSGQFSFRKGPVFTNILLGDEINRATPRTQSSLLEAMEEKSVTVDGENHQLEEPFFVLATQNPVELEGTYPLPFAQMDRFITRLSIGYLKSDDEIQVLMTQRSGQSLENIQSVMTCHDLRAIQKDVRSIRIEESLCGYIVDIVRATHEEDSLEFGASPRGSLDLQRFSQAIALIEGRDYVLPDDVKSAARHVLPHRLIARKGTRSVSLNTNEVIDHIIDSVEVPV